MRAFALVLTAVTTAGLISGAAIAEEAPQHLLLHLRGVGPTNETDYVSGTCDQKGSTLECHLTSSFILYPKGESEIQAEIDKQLPGWAEDAKSKPREQLCAYLNMTNDSQFRSRSTPQAKQLVERQDAATKAMCADPSESNIKTMMREDRGR